MSSPTIGVQSIRRAFAILRALGDGPLGVSEVATAARVPKSTAARILAALAAEGAVEQVPGERRYRLGPDLLAIAQGLSETWDIVAIARPVLEELAAELGEAAGVAIRDGWTVQYVDQVEPPDPNPVQVRDWTGTRIPLHAVSSGQVFLAQLAAPVLARYLAEPLEAFTPRTLTDASALLERLRNVRRDGHAWVRDEFSLGLSSVAAPIADARAEVVAAVHVHGPSYRFPAPGEEERIAAAVRTAAAKIGARLRAGG
ncbi:MAG TPA: IclR family transcriptional regulator [Candidatus Binatia bacterium]|nr:IclR family transcriptional regulator [Candidatus Binatia bacterium]